MGLVTHGLLCKSTGLQVLLPPPICIWYNCAEPPSIFFFFGLVYILLDNVANHKIAHTLITFKDSLPYSGYLLSLRCIFCNDIYSFQVVLWALFLYMYFFPVKSFPNLWHLTYILYYFIMLHILYIDSRYL